MWLVRVQQLWRANGLRPGTIAIFTRWVRRFHADGARRGDSASSDLTRRTVTAFARRYARRRTIDPAEAQRAAAAALRAWAFALAALGHRLPRWTPPACPRPLRPLLREYLRYRRHVRGVADASLRTDVHVVERFLAHLRTRGRRLGQTTVADLDAFVLALRSTMTRRSVAGLCSALRAFLRFLHATGRQHADLAASVVAPRVRAGERPPRALAWTEVRRILGAVDHAAPRGRRDYALLLLMASYGLGAAEARTLALDDIDWRAGTVRIRRPKTGVVTVLPLLPEVGRALAAYVRHARPRHTAARTVFVVARAPYGPLGSSSAIRHRLVLHARAAGIVGRFLGSHALRHSHACRQIELGAPPQVLSDILGHRRPTSTSAYVRIATTRLRALALPVPR